MAKKKMFQKTKEIMSQKDSSHTKQSSYWDWVKSQPNGRESSLSNPDYLAETEIAGPSTPQLIFGEAVEHLQGKQREVYLLVMRDEKSLAEVGSILGISKGSAQKYKERAIKFIESWCKQAIAKGRV